MIDVSRGGTVAIAGLSALFLVSCTGTPPPTAPPEPEVARPPLALEFHPLAVPPDVVQTEVIATAKVKVGGVEHAITWQPLLREDQSLRDGPYGVLVDQEGRPLERPTCGSADYGGLIAAHGEVFHVGHLECEPGAIWLAELHQDEAGALIPQTGRPVDLSAVQGGKDFCAGHVTPWQSLLSAQEYEPDASRVAIDGRAEEGLTHYDVERLSRYYVPQHAPYPYDFGWVLETRIQDADGETGVQTRYAMGRFSHEIARLMPDRRTVYLSDDTTNGGLFLFVADREGDLSAGTLYAARFEQTSPRSGGQGSLTWISLAGTLSACYPLAAVAAWRLERRRQASWEG